MIATMISAGTPYSASARDSAASFSRQKSTPWATRESVRKIGRYSFHGDPLGRPRNGVEDGLLALGLLEQITQLFAGETVVAGHLRYELVHVGAGVIRGLQRHAPQHSAGQAYATSIRATQPRRNEVNKVTLVKPVRSTCDGCGSTSKPNPDSRVTNEVPP